MAQYAVLVHLFAMVSGLVAGELVHVIADAHIYDRHVPIVEELLTRTPYEAPGLTIEPRQDFYAFVPQDVRLTNYQYHPLDVKIPVAE